MSGIAPLRYEQKMTQKCVQDNIVTWIGCQWLKRPQQSGLFSSKR